MTSGPHVTVFRGKFARSWPEKPGKPLRESDLGTVERLGFALEEHYSSDAHFVAYESPNGWRLNSKAPGHDGSGVYIGALVLDVDGPGKGPPDQRWRDAELEKVQRAAAQHGGPYFYETRGGYRIVWALPKPFRVDSPDRALRWRRLYVLTIENLRRRFGIEADAACQDWTRLYRLPNVVRDGSFEDRHTWGSPHRVATFQLAAAQIAAEDRQAARLHACWRPARIVTEIRSSAAPAGDGMGLLYHLLRDRGWLGSARGDGFLCRCPNEAQHSGGRTGDGSTMIYRPEGADKVGWIHCLHSHCASVDAAGWLAMFGADELARAERAAGLADERTSYTVEQALADIKNWNTAANERAAEGNCCE